MNTPYHSRIQWNVQAALGAWLLPGFGHFLLGQRQRGTILAASIGSLWLGGVLIGGIDVINRHDHTAWFIGQALIAPSVVVDFCRGYMRKHSVQAAVEPMDVSPPPSYGRVEEQGILYTALSGLLNLLVVMDVLHCDPVARRRADQRATTTTRLVRSGVEGE